MEQRQLFKVRDLRKKDQFKIDDRYLNGYARIFGVSTTAVYSSLCRHAEFYSQKAFPSERLIAEEHNISIRTVRRAIEKLKSANIVNIEKVRSSKGQWLNNTYFLIDKLEWKKPEDIKDLWETRGQKQQEPEDIRDATRGHHVSIKDNTLRRITHKKDNTLAKQSFAGKEINDLIDMFKEVNPSYKRIYSNKTQRAALERIVKDHGTEKIEWVLGILPQTNKEQFAPVITTPLQLEDKLGSLLAFYQKKGKDKKLIKIC